MMLNTQFPIRKPGRPLALAIVFMLSACSTTAPKPPPGFTPPAQFKEEGPWKRAGAMTATAVPETWWQLFHDPVLDDLQRQLVIGNESLKGAAAQVASARAAVKASQAALWPTLSVNASGTRSGNPATTVTPAYTSSSDSLTANAAWEVDLWGRLSQGGTVAESALQASRDDLAAARLSAQALLAQTYLAMRAAEVQQELLTRTVSANQRNLELTQARYASGVVSQSDVLQAQTQLRTAQVQAKEAAAQRAQLEHAIAVLLGRPPSALSIQVTAALPETPIVPELLPSTLLERRPDIAAAERRVAAAYAQIGVTNAAFFPTLTLSASGGYRASAIDQLVSAPNLLWSLGPALAYSVLDGGTRQLASDQAHAIADQAASAYRQVVLTALQEVEDNLVLIAYLGEELQLQREALQAAQRNLEIAQDQYKAGTVSYLNVVAAQTSVLSSEVNFLSLRNRYLAAVNILLKNIGGNWQDA